MSDKARVGDEGSMPSLNEPGTGTMVQPTGHYVNNSGRGQPGMIVSAEMCFFCFDVLLAHLDQSHQSPLTPPFTYGSL